MAKEHACARVARNAGIALQIHGGIGYTWEHDLHIYFKRAKLNEFYSAMRDGIDAGSSLR